ncbi:MAG: response regulator [Planctomycetaceae bacterium]
MNTRPRILVIDDDPLFRNLMMTILGKEFTVVVAGEGSEGFQIATENPPDIAIIDLQMPGWDGMRTLKAMKSHPSLNQVKVVIMTSIATRKTVLEAIQGGAHDYIIKTSFRREEFLAKLLRLLPHWACETFDIMQARSPNSNSGSVRAAARNLKLDVQPHGIATDGEPRREMPLRGVTSKPIAVPAAELAGSPSHPALTAASASPSDPNIRAMMDHWE